MTAPPENSLILAQDGYTAIISPTWRRKTPRSPGQEWALCMHIPAAEVTRFQEPTSLQFQARQQFRSGQVSSTILTVRSRVAQWDFQFTTTVKRFGRLIATTFSSLVAASSLTPLSSRSMQATPSTSLLITGTVQTVWMQPIWTPPFLTRALQRSVTRNSLTLTRAFSPKLPSLSR